MQRVTQATEGLDGSSISTVTRGQRQMLCRGVWDNGKKPIGNTEVNPSGLLNCGKAPAWVEKLAVKVRNTSAHIPKSLVAKEHHHNGHMDQAAKVKVSHVDLDWHHKDELFFTLQSSGKGHSI